MTQITNEIVSLLLEMNVSTVFNVIIPIEFVVRASNN